MVLITATVQAQLEALEQHYARLRRDTATILMTESIAMAVARIEEQTGPFWSFPRPYPDLADLGWQWLKQGRYWIVFTYAASAYVITGIFFESADIPSRP